MIFAPVDGEVYGETIRGKFDFCLKVYRQFIVNYTVN